MSEAIYIKMTSTGQMITMVLPNEKGSYPAYYIHAAVEETEKIWEKLQNKAVILISIIGEEMSWQHDMSPWPAPALNKKMNDFTGGGDEYLEKLTEQIMPAVKQKLKERDYDITINGIVGYSMGGLFACYAMTKTKCFSEAASISGSLWYDHLAAYMRQVTQLSGTWYFSLGDQEAKTRNRRMSCVEKNTLEIAAHLKKQHIKVFYETNEGGHFQQIPERIAKGIDYLSSIQYL